MVLLGGQHQAMNVLTSAEKEAGWELLFDGASTKGWLSFHGLGPVKPGWTVKDGVLSISDPGEAGDIVTEGKYDWFELSVDFRLGKGQNSGIMFHVIDGGEAPWHSGPEVQIYDAGDDMHAERSGYLYQFYKPEKEATNPVGQWNTVVLKITKNKCSTTMNGQLYYEWVYNSPDFLELLKKSKFSAFPEFAKADIGRICIQGDHGKVDFRNVKIRPITR